MLSSNETLKWSVWEIRTFYLSFISLINYSVAMHVSIKWELLQYQEIECKYQWKAEFEVNIVKLNKKKKEFLYVVYTPGALHYCTVSDHKVADNIQSSGPMVIYMCIEIISKAICIQHTHTHTYISYVYH